MNRPHLLDLFCGAGGCSVGYHRAGFDVVGVDHVPMPRYPFEFHQADALEYLAAHGHEFDAIHASPPCQAYSVTQNIWGNAYPELVEPTRAALQAVGKPYVIENVIGAPLMNTVMLCGTMFGLKIYRHRLFETSFFMLAPPHGIHPERVIKTGRPVMEGQYMTVAGHIASVPYARKVMGIDWMTRDELSEAIPPVYTAFVGAPLLAALPAPATEGAA